MTPRILLLTLLFCFSGSALLRAGENGNTRTYRVTAYKKGDNKVTSQSNTLELIPPLKIFVPDAFTPNADGLNDRFQAKGEGIGNFSMKIYNRWGELVFESSDITQGWDGQFKGQVFPNTIYTYMISARGLSGGATYLNGSVTLLQ